MTVHGLLVLDKPPGVSTAHLVRIVARHAVDERRPRAGHAGTLDPFASGIVLALLGDATRLQDLAMGLEKTYVATVLLGEQTDTLDPDGELVAKADPGPYRPGALLEALANLVGEIDQIPPAYSALKVAGRRAYQLARKGKIPELRARKVVVRRLELLAVRWPRLDLRVRCGAGTYIRSLARDLGERLGVPAHLLALRRTAVGPFDVGRAVAIADPAELPERDQLRSALRPPLSIVEAAGLATVTVAQADAWAFVSGQAIAVETKPTAEGGRIAVTASTPSGRDLLLGLGAIRSGGALAPVVVLSGARAEVET